MMHINHWKKQSCRKQFTWFNDSSAFWMLPRWSKMIQDACSKKSNQDSIWWPRHAKAQQAGKALSLSFLCVSRCILVAPSERTKPGNSRCWRNQILITRLAQKISTNRGNRKGIAYQQKICFRTLGYLPQTPSAMQKRFHRHSKRHWRGWCRYLKTASSVCDKSCNHSQVALTLRVERWSAYLLQVAGPEESRVQNVVRVSQSAAIQKPSPVRSAAWFRPNDQSAKGGGHAVHWSHWSKRMISWHIMTIDSRSTMSRIQISRVVLAQFKCSYSDTYFLIFLMFFSSTFHRHFIDFKVSSSARLPSDVPNRKQQLKSWSLRAWSSTSCLNPKIPPENSKWRNRKENAHRNWKWGLSRSFKPLQLHGNPTLM